MCFVRLCGVLLAALVLFPETASAHLRLTSHQSRYGDTQKSGPCGVAGGERVESKVYWAKPGTQVMLVWDEYIPHPSHFRIAFDEDGDDNLGDPSINLTNCPGGQPGVPTSDPNFVSIAGTCWDQNNVTDAGVINAIGVTDDTPGVGNGGTHNYLYTLPNVACSNCTLQVIQVMYDKPPYTVAGNDIYYQCMDLVLDPAGPDTLTLINPGPGGTMDPNQNGQPSTTSGGCAASTGNSAAGSSLLLLLAVLVARRRRG